MFDDISRISPAGSLSSPSFAAACNKYSNHKKKKSVLKFYSNISQYFLRVFLYKF